jgi:hypothetical protein
MLVLANFLCCRIGKLPKTYLSFKSLLVWNAIIEKMECCLAGWKRLY